MNQSLDDYIRVKSNTPAVDLSLDEYIFKNKISTKTPKCDCEHAGTTGPSKFDRYKYQDDDEMEEDIEMPPLVPTTIKTLPPKNSHPTKVSTQANSKPIHQRLGRRKSIESIHTSQLQLFRENRFKQKRSVQNRLGKTWVNPAVVERNRIAIHALESFTKSASRNLAASDDTQGRKLLNAFTSAIEREVGGTSTKYDMQMQKEISSLQGKSLYYACPGGFVISSDGPGISGTVKVPQHTTDISMNQRFA